AGSATTRSLRHAGPASVDPRFICDAAKIDRVCEVVARWWPEAIAPADLASPALAADVVAARHALLSALDLSELV
ncbi:MAG: N-succinylarginine dihydrolase, partial [Sphingopyxis sp.]